LPYKKIKGFSVVIYAQIPCDFHHIVASVCLK